jgi:hypothetical protein
VRSAAFPLDRPETSITGIDVTETRAASSALAMCAACWLHRQGRTPSAEWSEIAGAKAYFLSSRPSRNERGVRGALGWLFGSEPGSILVTQLSKRLRDNGAAMKTRTSRKMI